MTAPSADIMVPVALRPRLDGGMMAGVVPVSVYPDQRYEDKLDSTSPAMIEPSADIELAVLSSGVVVVASWEIAAATPFAQRKACPLPPTYGPPTMTEPFLETPVAIPG